MKSIKNFIRSTLLLTTALASVLSFAMERTACLAPKIIFEDLPKGVMEYLSELPKIDPAAYETFDTAKIIADYFLTVGKYPKSVAEEICLSGKLLMLLLPKGH